MNQREAYKKICSELGYHSGLIEELEQAQTAIQRHLFSEAKRLIIDIDSLYFSGDIPIAYFKLLSNFDEKKIIELHRRVWNQSRVPLLYVVTPNDLRIYNCFEEPANPEKEHLDTQNRLIRYINLAANILEELKEFSKSQIDSGAFWKSETGQCFRSDRRADQKLLENLRFTRKALHKQGLEYPIIHNLLGRSIFILYLEDRGAINKDSYYTQFSDGAATYFDVIKDKDAAYRLFDKLEEKFNGDLFPVTKAELTAVESTHLKTIRELFLGTHMQIRQTTLWRPYDFGVIPIELISAIYEEFLHKEEGKGYTSEKGAYYTPHALVEFILNEVLPWPSDKDHRYDISILDPACGSGIFLVEAYRRLVARWKFGRNERSISPLELKDILTNYIYGVDVDPDAVRVAAFSLYLALMDYLEPKTIWEQIQFPYLVFCPDKPEDYGKNLFPMDIFKSGPFENKHYDIVVGNPPWKRDGLPEHISAYLRDLGFAQEIAQAFLWRARDFSSKGRVALVVTSKILFNIETNDHYFRSEFFGKNYVETVVNFSALRKTKGKRGRQLFVSAVGPATIFFYRTNPPEQSKSNLLYCTPKPTRIDNALPGITIDASEFKFLPIDKCITSDKIWKVAMWGTQRDLEIIEKFQKYGNLAQHFGSCKSKLPWKGARGFQTSPSPDKNKNKSNPQLSNMPFIDAKDITRFWVNPDKITKVKPNTFVAFGCMETYFGPHILIKEGQSNKRFCAAFTEYDCAFRSTITGVSGRSEESTLMKAITAYLNCSFSSYFLFMTASTWGIERERVYHTEVFQLPDLPFHFTKEQLDKLASKVDTIGKLMADGLPDTDTYVRKIEDEIDQIIYDFLDLSESERFLIEDVLQYSLDFFQEGENSKACDIVDTEDLDIYAKTFCAAINSILQFGDSGATAIVYNGDVPLRLVSIRFSKDKKGETVTISDSTDELKAALENLDRQIPQKYSESIYVRRNVKFYDKDTLHVIKPDEKRFWTRSMALRDADETLAEGLNRGE
ncbi:MAG: SAM-dependent methyltransferase [Euryarchaeota archaeon]|nr:SAM-dependent methyltransferase [Euryarchaeota archaeon]